MTLELRSTDLTVPATQNTAPILEFHCLYSHDLRRKSKRWQDGFLRFHTFNRRVMVYDTPRNFIGDMHWTDTNDPTDGDELKLEKGILVQVGEGIGRMEQDISALFEKKIQARADRRERHANIGNPSPTGDSTEFPLTLKPRPCEKTLVPAGMSHLRPRTLNSLLGTPLRNHGRAMILTDTPAQSRQIEYPRRPEAAESGGPSKRQKRDYTAAAHTKDGYAGKLTPSILNLATPVSGRPAARPAIRPITARTEKAPQPRPRELSMSPGAPSIPQPQNKAQKKRKSQVIEIESEAEAPNKSFQKLTVTKTVAVTPRENTPQSPPVEADTEEAQVEGPARAKLRKPLLKPLRLAPRRPRNKLLCRDAALIREARLAREEVHVSQAQRTESPPKDNEAENYGHISDFDIGPLTLSDDPSEGSLPEPHNPPPKPTPTLPKTVQPLGPNPAPAHIKRPTRAGTSAARSSLKKSLSENDGIAAPTLANTQPVARLAASFGAPEEARDLGPWSREAFDLFAWRPPDRSAAATVVGG